MEEHRSYDRLYNRFKMLTRWLTLTAVLAGSVITEEAASGRGAVTFAPTCSIKSHPEVELTLNCGDGESAGVVKYWHTPFGDLQTPGFQLKPDPAFMHHDGSLVIPNASILHSGLYYCLLQSVDGTTLWQYELHVHPDHENHTKHEKYKQFNSCAAVRLRRSAGSSEERQAGVSDGLFAGAVAASVLLTFVVGFSAGALSRTHVLRCFGAVKTRLQSPKRRRHQTDTPDRGPHVTMTAMPITYNNQALESESDSAHCATVEATTLTGLCPPAKPQRSFRHRREEEEEEEVAAYLERCDQVKEENGEEEEVCDGGSEEKQGETGVYLPEDEDKHSEDREVEAESVSKEDGDEVGRGDDGEKTEEVKEKEKCAEPRNDDVAESSSSSSSSAAVRGRGSRVIRLYQYDEDGQRFRHLPDPAPEDQSPAPKLKQRSISLTRLSAIMAAASAGPLEEKEADAAESEERPRFHMEI